MKTEKDEHDGLTMSTRRLIKNLQTLLASLTEECRCSHLRSDISEGRSAAPFPSTPLNLSAIDLLDESEETLEQVVAGIGVWSGSWQSATTVLLEKTDDFVGSGRFEWDLQRMRRLEKRLAKHFGLGGNPDSAHDERVSFIESNPQIALSAADAARVLQAAGVDIVASTIRQWAHRGKLATVDRAQTAYRLADILALAGRGA
jgi:hypothetical protein